ncbi:MAG: hypothetical protein LC775_10120 [Acidobacteria bacterium]|nr:hypothetical protein [Acidobacteriota bacterium]
MGNQSASRLHYLRHRYAWFIEASPDRSEFVRFGWVIVTLICDVFEQIIKLIFFDHMRTKAIEHLGDLFLRCLDRFHWHTGCDRLCRPLRFP